MDGTEGGQLLQQQQQQPSVEAGPPKAKSKQGKASFNEEVRGSWEESEKRMCVCVRVCVCVLDRQMLENCSNDQLPIPTGRCPAWTFGIRTGKEKARYSSVG
eukprot:1133671-Pelagomonas_calceolata.AAC.25